MVVKAWQVTQVECLSPRLALEATIGFSERMKATPAAERMATVPAVAILTQRVTVAVEGACRVRWQKQ